MSLPTTNITTTIVANAIGESSHDISVLRNSTKNNYWGFSSDYVASKYWGKRRQDVLPVAYALGDYRGYDHFWRCFAFGEYINNSVSWEDGNDIDFNLIYFPSWSTPDGTTHHFSVEFKRTSDFDKGDGTFIYNDLAVTNGGFNIFFRNDNPPDGGVDLEEGQEIYFKIKHLSSDVRRWDDEMTLFPHDNTDEYIIPITVKDKGWTYFTYPYSRSASGGKIPSSTDIYLSANIGVMSDNPINNVVSWYCKMSPTYDFSLDVITLGNQFTADGQSTAGGGAVLSTDNVNTTTKNYSVGKTIYYKIYISSVSSGTFSASELTGSFVIQDELPI